MNTLPVSLPTGITSVEIRKRVVGSTAIVEGMAGKLPDIAAGVLTISL